MLHMSFSPDMSSGVAAMDELHHEFFDAMSRLSTVPDQEFSTRYRSFVNKAERAFFTEEQWMEEIDFPVLKSHREQHARVLGALHHVYSRVLDGDLVTGREVINNLLPQWFAFHTSTMDSVLASAMKMTGAQIMPPAAAQAVPCVD